MNMGNGGTVSNTFDLNGRLTAANPGATMERDFTYDANGHLLTVTAANTPWVNRTFAYDGLNRLTSATGPFGTFSYLYDDTGNRLSAVLGSRNEVYSYFAGTNRLSEIDGTEETLYAYDTDGNTTSMGSLSLAWNREGRLIRVESGSTPVSQYLYNAFGQRVLKSAGGLTTLYLYDFDGNLISETDGSGAIVTEYLYRERVRLAMADRATGAVYTFHNNELGTPELMTDSTNTVVWEGISKPFGETAVNSGSTVVNNFRFQGQYYDAETGLHYNGQRYYDPKTGRYLTPDPIGLAGGVNPYVYVGNDPVNLVDPLGLMQEDIDTAIALARSTQTDLSFPADNQYYVTPASDMGISPATGKPPSAYTDPSGTYLNADKYLPILNDKQATDLLDTIIHEGIHWWLSPWDPRQEDDNGNGYPYQETKRRMTKDLINEYLKMRKAKTKCE